MAGRLKLQLSNLSSSGWRWQGTVARAELEDAGVGEIDALHSLEGDASWDVELCKVGACFHLSGEWRLRIARVCDRCNADFVADMQGETMREFRLAKRFEAEDQAADVDVLPYPGHVDMVDVLREDIWLALSPAMLCRPDCKGLCLRCGCNLNQETCGCTSEKPAHPFAVLEKLKK
ncbi:MAG: DUF177 domain-containing protein [Mariprofundaceae bacterium]